MQTIEIKGWIFAKPDLYSKGIKYEFSDFDYEKAIKGGYGSGTWKSYKKVADHTITVEVADDVDPVALMIAGLEGEREVLRAEFNRKVNEINDRIQSLQAIEYTPAQEVAEPCKRCGGSGFVDDGEITGCGGVEFNNGPIRCVKDCQACHAISKAIGEAA